MTYPNVVWIIGEGSLTLGFRISKTHTQSVKITSIQ